MASVFSSLPLNVSFRRALVGEKLRMWIKLVSDVMHVGLEDTEDQLVWKVNEKAGFSVMSMYRDLMMSNCFPEKNISWKLRVPLKIKKFLMVP